MNARLALAAISGLGALAAVAAAGSLPLVSHIQVLNLAAEEVANPEARPPGWLKIAGYKELKWGMSPGRAKKAAALPLIYKRSHGDQKELMFGKGGESLGCSFLHDRLFKVQISPKGAAKEVEAALAEKYGRPNDRREENVSATEKKRITTWTDGSSEIESSVLVLSPDGGVSGKESEIVTVSYADIELKRQAEEDAASSGRKKQEKTDKTLKDQL
ncbi:MAG: hypothetical protein NTX64_00300 [Elusimicrobia bacterium]|nr:hypothetical protein [Elusimicrobiota bacterium]